MMKNKFIILSILSLFITSCSISNPLKKESKIIAKDCPQSLILYEARTFDFDDAIVELPTGYDLSCYLIEQEGVVEISTNYSLNVNLKEKEKEIYQVYLTIFVTDQSKEIKIKEFQFSKDLKIQKEEKNFFVFNFNDKIQIDSDVYNEGIKLFYALN
tara:strand:- start:3574 stop:4044 length:471 start_codon:yes stop_codon:yes gene_type:complete